MGYIRHNAIICTGEAERLKRAFIKAAEIFGNSCVNLTSPSPAGMNGTCSFLVAPDGSKEGWTDSDEGDRLRELFVAWLAEEGPLIDYIEVEYGGDESWEARVRTPTDQNFRRVPAEDK